MPSLKTMLEDTMLFVAARGASTEPTGGGPSFAAPAIPTSAVSDQVAATMPIWHWTTNQPSIVDQVTCIARGMGNARMLVCEQIRFVEVFVQAEGQGATPLDLDRQFLVKSFGLERGKIHAFDPSAPRAGSHFLYPLQAEVDKSYLHVLVFDFPNGLNNTPVAVDPAVIDTSDFMPPPGGVADALAVEGGQCMTITVAPVRVVVFVSLVCCKERSDFDPGGLLGAGKMIPHLMIMCNRPLESVRGVIHLRRPDQMRMLEGGDHALHSTMNDKIEMGLWGDSNDVPGLALDEPVDLVLPSPFWNDLFDCYLLGNSNNNVANATGASVNALPFLVVRPGVGARAIVDAVEKLQRLPLLGPRNYGAATIARVERQGCFDNIHIAPTMRTNVQPPGKPSSLTTPADVTRFYGLDRVFMAPFCEHDCLHTHWRWGTSISQAHNFGWSAPDQSASLVPGRPYVAKGAPMVPHNQEVRIDLTGSSSFMYRVNAGSVGLGPSTAPLPIQPGTYTCINLHGSGYALSVNDVMLELAKFGVSGAVVGRDEPLINLPNLAVDPNSAFLYWHLRFGGNGRIALGDIVQERIRYRDMAKVLND